jgi:hypothetical protein
MQIIILSIPRQMRMQFSERTLGATEDKADEFHEPFSNY